MRFFPGCLNRSGKSWCWGAARPTQRLFRVMQSWRLMVGGEEPVVERASRPAHSRSEPSPFGRSAGPQQCRHGPVFIDIGPPMSARLGCCVSYARKPLQRRIEFTPVGQDDVQHQIGGVSIDRIAIQPRCRNAHARTQDSTRCSMTTAWMRFSSCWVGPLRSRLRRLPTKSRPQLPYLRHTRQPPVEKLHRVLLRRALVQPVE